MWAYLPTKLQLLTSISDGLHGFTAPDFWEGVLLQSAIIILTDNGKGSFFSPYAPLQHLDMLASYETKSYVVGSTNSLLLQQKDRYADILINLDENCSVTISSPSLRTALTLSPADRRWIDFLTQTVNDTWDPENPDRPKNLGYAGSEEFLRLQFEEYILALLSSAAFRIHQQTQSQPVQPAIKTNGESSAEMQPTASNSPQDPTADFNPDFLSDWTTTPNFQLFAHLTSEAGIFDVITPSHPTAGALSVEDVQRRLAQQVADLHLDDRMREGREMLNRGLASGRERVNRFWAEVEARRIRTQLRRGNTSRSRSKSRNRKSGESATFSSPVRDPVDGKDNTNSSPANATAQQISATASVWAAALRDRAAKVQRPDTSQIQANARETAAKTQAYFNSWGSWARERNKEWQESRKSGGIESSSSSPRLRGGEEHEKSGDN